MTNNESGLNVNKPIQIPAWALVLLLGGGGSWLTWREIQGGPSDAAFAATPERHNCAEDVRTDVVSLKAEVAGLKAQVSQMDARLARIEDALINKR
jgi:hypothetical protein